MSQPLVANVGHRVSTVAALDRHDQRRHAGVPTVSVLSGPVEIGAHSWRHWAGQSRRFAVDVETTVLSEVSLRWAQQLAQERSLRDDAIAYLAGRLRLPAVDIGQRLGRQTTHELHSFLEHHLADDSASGAATACRWLLEDNENVCHRPPEDWLPELDRVLKEREFVSDSAAGRPGCPLVAGCSLARIARSLPPDNPALRNLA